MDRWIGRYAPQLYALMRIVLGVMFASHGTQLLFGFPGDGTHVPMASLAWFAGVFELVCGVMIGAGLWTGWAAFIASGEMAVAYFKAHAPHGFWPVLNHGELAVVYCFVFLYMASRGNGIWSLQRPLRSERG